MTTALPTGIELFSDQSFGKMVSIESSFVFPRVLMFPETKGTKQYKFGIGHHFRFINRCPTCRQVMSSLRRKICAQHRWHMDPGAVSRIGRKVDYEQALPFFWSIEQNAQDTQMTTKARDALVSRLAASPIDACVRALPSENLTKKNRNCSQSRKKAPCEEQVLSSEFRHPTLVGKV